jgi:type IV pilus assembly protein PilO
MAAAKKSALSKLGLPGKVAVGLLMLALPFAGYFTIFHSEIQAEINAAKNTHNRLQSDLESAKSAEIEYQKDVQELAERERNKRELMKVLPARKETPAFLSSLQNVANLVGVELVAWTPQEEVPEEFYARIPMQLELTGSFHQVAKFMYNVGQLERIINMEDISITGEKTTKATSREVPLKVKVLATAFYAISETAEPEGPGSRRRRERQ